MSVLTDEEIRKWWASENGLEDCDMCKIDDFVKVVRAIESALLQKLAAGVSVEPAWYAVMSSEAPIVNKAIHSEEVAQEYADKCSETYPGVKVVPLYTAEAVAAARVQENERCAKVCEAPHHYFNDCKTNSECATAIRALLGKEVQS